MSKPSRQAGFTLIELLVVIGIIAILLSFLLPTLSKARANSQRIACRAQLKDIGNAFQMYLQDFKGRIPRVNPLPSYQPKINDYPFIIEVFLPYTKNVRTVFRCPSDHITNEDTNRTIDTIDRTLTKDPRYIGAGLSTGALTYYDREGSSYEYNTFLNAFQGGDMFHIALSEAKEKMHIDSAHFRIFNDFEPFHGKKLPPGSKTIFAPGSTNYLFADWHVGDLVEG